MVGDRLDIAAAKNPAEAAASTQHESGSWFANNVLDPFIHGTGVVQVYNTFADKKDQIALPETHQAKTFSADWAVQSLSGAAGAIIPYVLAGKVMGSGMRALGGELGLQGGAARFMASESAAQIMGAGAYDFIKAPNQGETRFGNAVGTMAGFSVFEGGNKLLSKAVPMAATTQISRLALTGVGRFGVGAVGGLTSRSLVRKPPCSS
ncbi:MAG: hypothetical protein HYX67_01965 [Candidatus Melainabacteria bacterium]|nr:hypothetical protein [Candidatus Melainabacteria bacterium]